MSSIGVPSRAITSAAAATVSPFHGRPSNAASVASARIGVAATPPRPILARRTVRSATSSANPTATPEMSSNRRFATLWKATSGLPGSGTRTARMSSSGSRTVSR